MSVPSELSSRARAIVDAARAGEDPTPADRARVRAALAVTLAAAGLGTAAGAAAAGEAAATGGAGATAGATGLALTTKILASVALLATVGGAGWWVAERRLDGARRERAAQQIDDVGLARAAPSPAMPQVAAPSEPPALAVPAVPAVDNEPAPQHPPAAPRQRAAPDRHPAAAAPEAAAPAPEPSSAREEIELIGRAQAALRRGDASGALVVLDRLAARHPHGVMAPERAATRVVALCRAGRGDEARAEADAFLRRWPRSPLAARVRAACPLENTP